MKKTLLSAAMLAAIAVAAPAAAHDPSEAACLDAVCDTLALFDTADDTTGGGTGAAIAAPKMGEWGIDLAGMDRSVAPGADFFGYVNGNWARTTEIPADRSN